VVNEAFASVRRLFTGFGRSPWRRVAMPVPTTAFGPGSRRRFADYFDGATSVRVRTLDEIVAWLDGCEYVSDTEQFQDLDVWQHPAMFEERRRGDCEDFALWAWRKLTELGIDAEFFVGRFRDRQHAWVVYRLDGAEYLFEPAAGRGDRMIRPLADAKDEYVPHFAVDRHFATTAFVGCLQRGNFVQTARVET
jgi:hypothetical protein